MGVVRPDQGVGTYTCTGGSPAHPQYRRRAHGSGKRKGQEPFPSVDAVCLGSG